MNRLNKIFLSIIIVLAISLIIMIYLYFNMRNIAYQQISAYSESTEYSISLTKAIEEAGGKIQFENPEQPDTVYIDFSENIKN